MIDELAKQIIKDAALLGGIAIVPRWDTNDCFIHVRMPDGPRDVGCLVQISNLRSGTTQEELFGEAAWKEWAEFFLQYARIPGLNLAHGDNSFMVQRGREPDPDLPPDHPVSIPHKVLAPQTDPEQPNAPRTAWRPDPEWVPGQGVPAERELKPDSKNDPRRRDRKRPDLLG